MSHEDVARRLREQGMATAPPDLAERVMTAVRADPQRSRRTIPGRLRGPRLRPLAGWATAAACLVAAGFGIAHLGGAQSGVANSSAPAAAAGAVGGRVQAAVVTLGFADRRHAAAALGPLWRRAAPATSGVYRISVTRRQLDLIRARASRQDVSTPPAYAAGVAPIRVVLRVRSDR